MHTINIIHAEKKHKDFILHANDVINNVNDTEQTNGLRENIDKDYFCDNPKFKCLIAEIDGNPVGMILYSYFYWANDGEVLWISQMFIEEEYRKIVSCATGDENIRMQKILRGYKAHEINLKFYYKKI